ncbi:uncharacterized protein N7500_008996 [Penicillium coprophilum]|uniref:uncharacterized protein n=1 Tax=Penicillium coprophilum TaxID=36646 RepID=UPI00239A2DE4|nr:uncharacterized protein N7500_008996 [Penicillium coprophilum]KAJ5159345.1 hypothetical protein N7500_008996 [Penicillium coprophilum]
MSDFKWKRNFVAECSYPAIPVVNALARYIYEGTRSGSWEGMEESSEKICDVAFHVFDRYGTCNEELVYGEASLTLACLFLLEKLHFTALELHRKGLGQKLVENADHICGPNEAFERAWTLHTWVSPGYPAAKLNSQLVGKSVQERFTIWDQVRSGAIDFWRSPSRGFASLISSISLVPLRRLRVLTRVEAILETLRTKDYNLSTSEVISLK